VFVPSAASGTDFASRQDERRGWGEVAWGSSGAGAAAKGERRVGRGHLLESGGWGRPAACLMEAWRREVDITMFGRADGVWGR
jgi:hypothetical protein